MIYIFTGISPNRELLLAKDLTNEYVDTLVGSSDVVLDDKFDRDSAIDAATLDAADRLLKDFMAHHLSARIGLTRKFPYLSHEYRLVLELPKKISGMDSYVSRFMWFKRMEYQETLTFNEIFINK